MGGRGHSGAEPWHSNWQRSGNFGKGDCAGVLAPQSRDEVHFDSYPHPLSLFLLKPKEPNFLEDLQGKVQTSSWPRGPNSGLALPGNPLQEALPHSSGLGYISSVHSRTRLTPHWGPLASVPWGPRLYGQPDSEWARRRPQNHGMLQLRQTAVVSQASHTPSDLPPLLPSLL